MTQPAADAIIRGSTRLGAVPLVPEIRLYQASEPMSVWQHTEQATGQTGLDPPFWAFAWPAARPWPGTCSTTPRRSPEGT